MPPVHSIVSANLANLSTESHISSMGLLAQFHVPLAFTERSTPMLAQPAHPVASLVSDLQHQIVVLAKTMVLMTIS